MYRNVENCSRFKTATLQLDDISPWAPFPRAMPDIMTDVKEIN